MNADATKLLTLMFRPEEYICVSHNKYGYHSVPLKEVINSDHLTMVPTPESCEKRSLTWTESNFERIKPDEIRFVALNPIKGFREDANCLSYRNFIIDLDYGELDTQLEYVRGLEIPFSAIVFTGNRGFHILISIDKDLPSESVYRHIAQWTLNIATIADQNCKNPSRSLRLAGAIRENGNEQRLEEFKGKVRLENFAAWLAKHPASKPKPVNDTETVGRSEIANPYRLSPWVRRQLRDGLDFTKGRNKTWFSIACDFAKAGFPTEEAESILEGYFIPERDFSRREWKTAIRSGYKFIDKR